MNSYIGLGRWRRIENGWELQTRPPLRLPPRTTMDWICPGPPDQGGPEGWFPIEFNFKPLETRKDAQAALRWLTRTELARLARRCRIAAVLFLLFLAGSALHAAIDHWRGINFP